MGCTALCQLINRSVSASLVFMSRPLGFMLSSSFLMSSALVWGSLQSLSSHFWRVSGLVWGDFIPFSLVACNCAGVRALPPFLLSSMWSGRKLIGGLRFFSLGCSFCVLSGMSSSCTLLVLLLGFR